MNRLASESTSIVPSVSVLINLTSLSGKAGVTRQLAALTQQCQMPTTWVIQESAQAKSLAELQLASSQVELALTTDARSPQRLRSELASCQASIQAATGKQVSVLVGDAQHLRSRAALLANLGIEVIVDTTSDTPGDRPLPCGLWQLSPTLSIPQPQRRWSLLPNRRPSVKQLLSGELSSPVNLISLEPASMVERDWRACERLLRELQQAAQHGKVTVSSVLATAAKLRGRDEVKPQRSILRRAA